MAEARRINTVHRSLSKPLTILGAERKLFFFAMCVGAGTFNLLDSLAGRRADVPAALLRCTLGDQDRSADSAVSAYGPETAHAIRSRKVQARFDPQGEPCLG